jgi:hypothetical protein
MDYIKTSHPNFIGGGKAVEMALQQIKSSRIAVPVPGQKVNLLMFLHFYSLSFISLFLFLVFTNSDF